LPVMSSIAFAFRSPSWDPVATAPGSDFIVPVATAPGSDFIVPVATLELLRGLVG
jgi:hypothetical protein